MISYLQYLSGRNADVVGVRYGSATDRIVPRHIKDLMFSVQGLTNYLSHEYVSNNVATRPKDILFSLALQICEIILWLNNYIANHKDKDVNRKMCKTIGFVEEVKGNSSIYVIKSNRPGREACICMLAEDAKNKGLIGKKVVVVLEQENPNLETQKKYPYLAVDVHSLEKENGSK